MAETDSDIKGERVMVSSLSLGALVALVCGLDRVAILQVMISRPIVAAPLAALLLGEPMVGLQIGVMVELLWLARLPVGAAVPPDDTQVAIATSVLTVVFQRVLHTSGIELTLLCLLIATPLGKVGQYFDHYARQRNISLATQVDTALDQGSLTKAEFLHLRGLINFSLAALGTYAVVIVGGLVVIPMLWPLIQKTFGYSTAWVEMALPLIGVAVVLGTINASRAITLFCASFCMAFLLIWLVK